MLVPIAPSRKTTRWRTRSRNEGRTGNLSYQTANYSIRSSGYIVEAKVGHVKAALNRYRLISGRFCVPAGRRRVYHMGMIRFDPPSVQYLFLALAAIGAAVLLFVGYRLGRWVGTVGAARLIASKEQELFTAQKGFKTV